MSTSGRFLRPLPFAASHNKVNDVISTTLHVDLSIALIYILNLYLRIYNSASCHPGRGPSHPLYVRWLQRRRIHTLFYFKSRFRPCERHAYIDHSFAILSWFLTHYTTPSYYLSFNPFSERNTFTRRFIRNNWYINSANGLILHHKVRQSRAGCSYVQISIPKKYLFFKST